MKRVTYRNVQNLMLFITIFVLVFAFYSEYIQKLQPCPLCLMQRFCAFAFALLCLFCIGARSLHNARFLAIMQAMVGGLGLYFAGRQLWLQSLPVEQSQVCMPGLDALMHYFPWPVVVKAFFWGTSECSEVTGSWLGLSLPGWAAIYFSLIIVVSITIIGYLTVSLRKAD